MAQAAGRAVAQVSLGPSGPSQLGVWGWGESCRGALWQVCDLNVEICVSGIQFQKCEDFNTSAHVQALFARANQPLSSWKQGAEWTEHRLGDRTGFIPTDSLLTLEKLLNFPEPQFHRLYNRGNRCLYD